MFSKKYCTQESHFLLYFCLTSLGSHLLQTIIIIATPYPPRRLEAAKIQGSVFDKFQHLQNFLWPFHMTHFIPKINREQKVLVMLKCVKKIRSSQDNIICISFCCLPLLSGKSMILFSFSQRTLKQNFFAKTTTHTLNLYETEWYMYRLQVY